MGGPNGPMRVEAIVPDLAQLVAAKQQARLQMAVGRCNNAFNLLGHLVAGEAARAALSKTRMHELVREAFQLAEAFDARVASTLERAKEE